MGFKKEKEQEPLYYVMPYHSPEELKKFGEWLEGFRVEHTFKSPRTKEMVTVKIVDLNEAMVEFGAMTKRTIYGKTVYSVAIDVYGGLYKFPTKYELFQHKYKNWKEWHDKREYAEKMQVAGLQENGVRELTSLDYGLPF